TKGHSTRKLPHPELVAGPPPAAIVAGKSCRLDAHDGYRSLRRLGDHSVPMFPRDDDRPAFLLEEGNEGIEPRAIRLEAEEGRAANTERPVRLEKVELEPDTARVCKESCDPVVRVLPRLDLDSHEAGHDLPLCVGSLALLRATLDRHASIAPACHHPSPRARPSNFSERAPGQTNPSLSANQNGSTTSPESPTFFRGLAYGLGIQISSPVSNLQSSAASV